MYYPMRVVRDQKYKLIWNIAYPLPYPFASDLWAASSWQAQWALGKDANYGNKTVDQYVLKKYKDKLKQMQKEMEDPWIMKWDYE